MSVGWSREKRVSVSFVSVMNGAFGFLVGMALGLVRIGRRGVARSERVRRFVALLAMCVASAGVYGQSAEGREPSAASVPEETEAFWLVVSGASRHFRQDERDWREFNPGLGFERAARWKDSWYVGGYFRNSYDRHALYAGLRWMPLRYGPVSFGGFALASTGYPSPVLVLPGFAVDTDRIGVNVVVVPNIGRYSGYVGMQLRVRP